MNNLDVKVKYEEFNGKQYITLEAIDIPNLVSQGETYDEAYQELLGNYEALKEFYNSRRECLPVIKRSSANGKFLLRFPKMLHEKIIQVAEENGVSLNNFINNAISFYVGYLSKEAQVSSYNMVLAQYLISSCGERRMGYEINV